MTKGTLSKEEIIERALAKVSLFTQKRKKTSLANHDKVLRAFQDCRIDQASFAGSSGYGYGDHGRDQLDQLFAQVFGGEDALVRSQFLSGTHTLSVALSGLLSPAKRLVSFTGPPYDTLRQVIGSQGQDPHSLISWGIDYEEIDLALSLEDKIKKLRPDVDLVLLQRSRGYDIRPSLTTKELGQMISAVRTKAPQATILVDNCYGEFVEEKEPLELGADIIVGSLIKNPGGGLATSGGYVCGRKDLVEKISSRFSAPGIGKEVGAVEGSQLRLLYQGFYLAPHMVGEALKGAVYLASMMEDLGYQVSPGPEDTRTDTVQAISFDDPQALVSFVQTIQANSPVDAYAKPLPWPMPGYEDQVIMAAGTFVAGATSELTADGPLRAPYTVFVQGGLSFDYNKLAMDQILDKLFIQRR